MFVIDRKYISSRPPLNAPEPLKLTRTPPARLRNRQALPSHSPQTALLNPSHRKAQDAPQQPASHCSRSNHPPYRLPSEAQYPIGPIYRAIPELYRGYPALNRPLTPLPSPLPHRAVGPISTTLVPQHAEAVQALVHHA